MSRRQRGVSPGGLALRPPMGWNGWNHFGCKVDETAVRVAADALVSTGMKALGYQYVVVDDCWLAHSRDAQGNLQPDPVRFPHGVSALARYVHQLGLKFGMYEDAGSTTCRAYPGSFGHEQQDAAQFAAWGVDYLKYDFCHRPLLNWAPNIDRISVSDGASLTYTAEAESTEATLSGVARVEACPSCSGDALAAYIGNDRGSITFHLHDIPAAGTYRLSISFTNQDPLRLAWLSVNGAAGSQLQFPGTGGWDIVSNLSTPVWLQRGENAIRLSNPLTRVDNAELIYQRMHQALAATGRPIVLSICDPYRRTEPWRWGSRVGDLWRTTPDIQDSWRSILDIADQQVGLESWAGPGHWNDPDMLEVGNGGMSDIEDRAHFALWSMLAAPLFAGNDLTHMTPAARAALTNPDIIAVDQDSAGIEGTRILQRAGQEVWARPLAGGDRAILLLNRREQPTTFHLAMRDLSLNPVQTYLFRDLWSHSSVARRGEVSVTVQPHGSAMFRVHAADASHGG